eukprot:TRINITY_DN10538_c0_g1_i2.p1 TRINITY_DN10538_c0_g1~~TRINITY_DN10538_c0_g1_i2.p1  ORF type:complete len:301 (+),score=47.30 TRINITY_DN10538_c0_g1_i2:57-959(+)
MANIKDLSEVHAPISSNITQLPSTKEGYNKYKLTEEQLKFFHENGYVNHIPVLTSEQVDLLIEDLNEIMKVDHPGSHLWHEFHANESGDPNNVLFHSLGAWRISQTFHDLIWHPAINVPSSQLLGEAPQKVRFWHDQLFCKPAHSGGCVAWHQDYSYWTRTKPLAHLTIHIALDDQTEENGCLFMVPGSHKWPLIPITSLHFTDMDSIQTVLTEEQKKQFKPVPMLLKKGEASFHHALTVHGSYGNKSAGPRRATVVNVFKDGVVSNTNEELLKGTGIIPSGEVMTGQFFPFLFDPAVAF